jgi:hypothetical protein
MASAQTDSTTGKGFNERLLLWAREHGEEFKGGAAASAMGVSGQGIGPVLASMVRSGDLTVSVHGSKRVYAAAEETADVPDDGTVSDFELDIKGQMSTRLTQLKEEDEAMAARKKVIDVEIERLTNAIGELA